MDRRTRRRALKAKLFANGRTKCEACGEERVSFLQIDHVIPYFLGGTDDLDNLRILCGPCHEQRHRRDGTLSEISRTT